MTAASESYFDPITRNAKRTISPNYVNCLKSLARPNARTSTAVTANKVRVDHACCFHECVHGNGADERKPLFF
jgi:hypothetical protein